jgi:molecular chaperone HscB
MNLLQDHFALLGLPRRYALDTTDLEHRYRDVQARVHPDKHAHLGDAERRQSMQWATQVNAAYQTLKNPLTRARYLLELEGHDPEVERNTAMPTDFLVEQMELRETVAEARHGGNAEALETLSGDIRREIGNQFRALQPLLDDSHDYEAARGLVRRLLFQEKLLQDIHDALEAIEA